MDKTPEEYRAEERRRLAPVLEATRRWDVLTRRYPRALYRAIDDGFRIYATADDRPSGWGPIALPTPEGGCKPAVTLATVRWGWNDDESRPRVVRLDIETDAWYLADRRKTTLAEVHNRGEDLAWARRQAGWLFLQAGVRMPRPVEFSLQTAAPQRGVTP